MQYRARGFAVFSLLLAQFVFAAGGVVETPTGEAPDRYVYYPGTEALSKEEIRVTACGTGLPAARRGQAATCFLIETGNGDKFLFDIGTGSMANLAAMMIPYQYLDKLFLSHLHTDHMGDILGLWAGGWTAGRPNALQGMGPLRGHARDGHGLRHGAFPQVRQLGQGNPRVQGHAGSRAGSSHGIRLQGCRPGRLPGERCDHPLLPVYPHRRRPGQLQARVCRDERTVQRRYRTKQVVHQIRQGCGPGDSRVLPDPGSIGEVLQPATPVGLARLL